MKPFLVLLSLAVLSVGLAQEGPDSVLQGMAAATGFEEDCRSCHQSGVPDRHHSLYGQRIAQESVVPYPDASGDGVPETNYGCLNCHESTFAVVRNCVACHATPVGTVPDGTGLADQPLTVTSTLFDAITLSWGPSCSVTDADYAVYEGTLGDFASHTPILCSTDGDRFATFALSPGNVYYLAVPLNHWSEGSYGVDGNDGQRPPSTAACLSQTIGCP